MTATTAEGPRHRYRAFLSYSSVNTRQARALHRRLEYFRIPRGLTPGGAGANRRLRPIFRDDDELAGSGVLDEQLQAAIDQSAAMIVLASPAAADSPYVNDEIAYFLNTRDPRRLVIVTVGGDAAQLPPLPPALRGRDRELIWLDGRRGLNRRSFLRLVAALLDVDFDALFRRDSRRRRRTLVAWAAASTVLAAVLGGTFWRAQAAAERDPARQETAFRSFLEAKLRAESLEMGENGIQYEILGGEDLNGDGLLDYFVTVMGPAYCGSSGCPTDLYLADGSAGYRMVLSATGSSTPRTRAGVGTDRDVIIIEYSVSREPIYSVYRSGGGSYTLTHYEYCDGTIFEACSDPTVITPVEPNVARQVRAGVTIRERPDEQARPATVGAGSFDMDVEPDLTRELGTLPAGDWSLVEAWKRSAGFVRTAELE